MESQDIKIELPSSVKTIINVLEDAGYEAYAVGGCVRDSVLMKSPEDWDITTSAKPEQVKALFHKTIDTGIQHGTVTVMIKHVGYEVTTYRVDGEYEDGRHPKEVVFTSNLIEDLKRRDFTINAMAYNDRTGLIDCFGGIDDINNKIINCVGNPNERFSEDALRILRAIRFAAVLDFEIEENTKNAVEELAATLRKISRERIQAELKKLIMSDSVDRIRDLYQMGIIRWIFEDEDKDYLTDDYETMIKALKASPKDHYIRWALFITYTTAMAPLKSLKFDNKTVKICSVLKEYKDFKLESDESSVRKAAFNIGVEIFEDYYITYRMLIGDMSNSVLDEIMYVYSVVKNRGDCMSMQELAVDGNDLKEREIAFGKELGEILRTLLNEVLENPKLNTKETLLQMATNYIK